MKKQFIFSWILQIAVSIIMLKASWSKFASEDFSTYIFQSLGMGTTGMYLIAVIEAISAILLLSSITAHNGALLSFATMLGAIIAHLSILGLSVKGDGGQLVAMMFFVFISSFIILYIRRHKLPLIGHTCE